MPSTTSPINIRQLRRDYPSIIFKKANVARWSPAEQTVYYEPLRSWQARASLLHELGHALCGHRSYDKDIGLLRCEREAWQVARQISQHYQVDIPEDHIEGALDTYRQWLRDRSRCVTCRMPGIQQKDLGYRCIICGSRWHANDARQCGLRRYRS